MKCVFDPRKNISNQTKHGVSLALAEVLFAGKYLSFTDDRFNYGESRQIAFGLIEGRMFACVFSDRLSERRVISLRKANAPEVKRFGKDME